MPGNENFSSDHLLGRFLDYVEGRRLKLHRAQEEAVLELFEGKNAILNAPTASGKSLVASAMHFASVTSIPHSAFPFPRPIKARVNEKPRDLCRELGPDPGGRVLASVRKRI